MKRTDPKRLVFLLLAAAMLLFIWGQSCVPTEESGEESSFVTNQIVNPVLRFFGLPELSEHVVRKLAHMTEYALFSLFFVLGQSREKGRRGRAYLRTLGTALLVAFLDESIQMLTGRGPMISDVWIDLGGAAVGALAGWIPRGRKRLR